jgi:hypothetical protein
MERKSSRVVVLVLTRAHPRRGLDMAGHPAAAGTAGPGE